MGTHSRPVKGAILKFLGYISRYYPEALDKNQTDSLQSIYTRALETNLMQSKEPDSPLTVGVFLGLNQLLHGKHAISMGIYIMRGDLGRILTEIV
jgi:hypothetical protein